MTEWHWDKNEYTGCHYVYGEDLSDEVCVVYTGNEDHCRLIAAAPRMLALLKDLLHANVAEHLLQDIKAIINSTEGHLQ